MQYMYAALLLHKAGKKVEEDSLKKVIEATGTKADDARVKALVSALDGVDIDKAITEASMVQVAIAPAAAPAEHKAAKKEKEEDKKSEETAAAGLSALFG